MSDAHDGDEVECPICGGTFDPAAAGGWCTNPDCGEWQYDGDVSAEGTDGDADEDASVAAATVTDDSSVEESDADDAGAESDPHPATDPFEGANSTFEGGDSETDTEPDDDADVDNDSHMDTESVPDVDPDVTADADVDGDETDTTESEPEADGSTEADSEPEPDPPDTDAEPVEETEEAEVSVPATIECPDCGTELAADANFCIECGADVQAVDPGDDLTECPSCGTELSGDENFCANCGEDLDAHRGQGDGEADDTAAEDAVDALAAQSDEGAEAVPESLVLSVLGTDIEVADGDRVGREVRAALTDAGRTEDEAVRVHREHVRFIREADGFYLVDLGDNPTKLNGRALTKGDREPVGPGDEVDLSGVATLTIEAP
ncbi:zinc ribbon domain-containing protein [Halomicroarcula sp. GCM10025324]|uniref:zinc ribbon domain-containing protein n=1 Tax=Haloarcula TaxID=2237 RepID=UPI0023E7C200|nr:zinc ribbon domain-containing protein [Halomicroarcula sp. ZS-22-S1]